MTPVDRAEAERTVKTVVLCSMVGLLVGLAAATIMVSVRAGREEGEIEGQRASPPHTQIRYETTGGKESRCSTSPAMNMEPLERIIGK